MKDFHPEILKERIEQALKESPKDTYILNFKRICRYFFSRLSPEEGNEPQAHMPEI
ncbi:hypothetical protein [Aquifex sp.]